MDRAETRGRPRKDMAEGRRVDIALFNKKGELIHLIEVKLKWNKRTCIKDIDRLRGLLLSFGPRKGGSLKSGFLSMHRQGTKVNVNFYRKVHPGFVEKYDGKKYQYGSHIIELSRQNVKNA